MGVVVVGGGRHTIHHHPSVLKTWLTSLRVKYVDGEDKGGGQRGIQEEGVISEMKGAEEREGERG